MYIVSKTVDIFYSVLSFKKIRGPTFSKVQPLAKLCLFFCRCRVIIMIRKIKYQINWFDYTVHVRIVSIIYDSV